MPSVSEVIDALRSALDKQSVESDVQDAFNLLASCLVLLNSSSPSVQMIRKLYTALRQSLLPLYKACLQPALQLSSSVLSTVLGKICDAHDIEDEKLRSAWDETAKTILSGVLDFLDQKDNGNVVSDGAVWEALYRVICQFFFLDSGQGLPTLSIPLRLSAYSTLTETAAKHIAVRNAFRHNAILGGKRLGFTISSTRDYLLLEALLMLFARLLPPIHNTSQGKYRRVKFVKEVLGSPKLFKCSTALLDIMQKTSDTHWDDVAAQIIDTLAKSDITYPQPFSIDEIDVCGHVFPQPLAADRLIMDKQTFLANVILEDNDLCESLQVPYSHIRTITLDSSEKNVSKGKVLIMVYLASPPLVANIELKSPDGNLYAKFLLRNNDVGRFMEALRRRGVGKLCFLNPSTRTQSKSKSVSIGSGLKFVNNSSPVPPVASFEGKVQHVNEVYKTDIDESEVVPVPHARDGDREFSPTHDPRLTSKDEVLAPEVLASTLVEDVHGTLIPVRLFSPTKKMPKSISPGNFIGALRMFVDGDELSEISEFESENDIVAIGASTSRSQKSTRHKVDITQRNFNATSTMRIKKLSESSLNTGSRKGATQTLPETGKSPLPSFPAFASSSSTQIDVCQKSLSDADTLSMIGHDVIGGLYVASQDLVDADKLMTGSPRARNPTENEHARRSIRSSGANKKERSVDEAIKDTSVPPKIAGNRRRRETIEFTSNAIIKVDDESTPRKKRKSCDERHGIKEDNAKLTETPSNAISRTKRYRKPDKGSSPSTDPTMVDFGGLSGLKSNHQGTRRSSRIKRLQTAATVGTRAMCGKTQKVNQVDDPCAKISRDMSLIFCPEPTVTRETPSPRFGRDVPFVELSAKSIVPDTRPLREILKAGSLLLCEPSQPSVTPTKDPRGNPNLVQQGALDTMQLLDEQSHIKTEEIMDDQYLKPDLRTVDNNAGGVQEVVAYSFSSKEGEDPVESSRPINSTSRTDTVSIDLTIDNPPAQERSEPGKAFAALVRLEAGIQTKLGTPDQSNGITIKGPPLRPSPRHRRRSVTFASPIEYVPDKKVKSQLQVSSFSCRSPSPSESNILSPLGVPMNVRRESPDKVTPRATLQKLKMLQASAHDHITDEVEIQDIVEVLDEIQAAIVKGISNRFRNVRKDVQRGRDELIQRVLDELQDMITENARYFNGLVCLEGDYYKNGKAITRCWEDLIDCNDGIAVQFRNALAEHDRNICVKTFPKSLLPLKPVSLCRRANA